MDMFVDKSATVLFNHKEIDIICNGIEVVFKEFFKESGTYMAVHGIRNIHGGYEMIDHVIHCCNKATKKMRGATEESVSNYSYKDFHKLIDTDADRPHFHYNLRKSSNGLFVGSIGLEFDIGMVFAYCSIEKDERELIIDALYGLTLLICNVLLERSEWAKDLLPRIEASGFVDKIMHDKIKERVDKILQ